MILDLNCQMFEYLLQRTYLLHNEIPFTTFSFNHTPLTSLFNCAFLSLASINFSFSMEIVIFFIISKKPSFQACVHQESFYFYHEYKFYHHFSVTIYLYDGKHHHLLPMHLYRDPQIQNFSKKIKNNTFRLFQILKK